MLRAPRLPEPRVPGCWSRAQKAGSVELSTEQPVGFLTARRAGPGPGRGRFPGPPYEFLVAIVAKHHGLGGLTQLRLIHSVLEARSPDRGAGRAAPLGGSGGRPSCPTFWWPHQCHSASVSTWPSTLCLRVPCALPLRAHLTDPGSPPHLEILNPIYKYLFPEKVTFPGSWDGDLPSLWPPFSPPCPSWTWV